MANVNNPDQPIEKLDFPADAVKKELGPATSQYLTFVIGKLNRALTRLNEKINVLEQKS